MKHDWNCHLPPGLGSLACILSSYFLKIERKEEKDIYRRGATQYGVCTRLLRAHRRYFYSKGDFCARMDIECVAGFDSDQSDERATRNASRNSGRARRSASDVFHESGKTRSRRAILSRSRYVARYYHRLTITITSFSHESEDFEGDAEQALNIVT